MAKEKITLTLDVDRLEELRKLTGARSLSSTVDAAVADYLAKMRHLAAIDEWLAAMEHEHGPIPAEATAWAAEVFERWDAVRGQRAPGPG